MAIAGSVDIAQWYSRGYLKLSGTKRTVRVANMCREISANGSTATNAQEDQQGKMLRSAMPDFTTPNALHRAAMFLKSLIKWE